MNVFGNDKALKWHRENKDISIAGYTPDLAEESVHLGMIQCQTQGNTENVNVKNRITKTRTKLNMILLPSMRSGRIVDVEIKLKIYNTIICPSLLSGLSTLTLRGIHLKKLSIFENSILRRIMRCRNNCSIDPIYVITGTKPVEYKFDSAVLSLVYNMWINKNNPASILSTLLSETSTKSYHWGQMANDILAKLGLPNLKSIMGTNLVTKSSWKQFVGKKSDLVKRPVLA